MSRNRKPSIDPVILIALGILLLTIAVVMIVLQSNTDVVSITNNAGTASQLVVAFITGLTTGGLSCLAVQGGLLASPLAHQIEQDYIEQTAHAERKKRPGKKNRTVVHSSSAFPIFLFLIAKIVAYTLLGALLGLLGSYLTL
ncbi:MAG TPA: sulfite exporter TauE/SafE family protein, partial [Anaerolineales bacterium]|nr:sulfite exporter TauE/SafE family protein [Anaerolineales bacterium]